MSKTKNKVAQTSSIGLASVNLLKDPGMERGGKWSAAGSGLSISTTRKRTGYNSQKATGVSGEATYSQSVNLTAGKTYTFSGYVNTCDVTSFASGGGIYLRGAGTNGELLSIKTASDVAGGWHRVTHTFKATASGAQNVSIVYKGITGTAYADDFQLEEGDAAGNANLLYNSNAEDSEYWSLTLSDKTTISGEDKISGTKSFKAVGSPDKKQFFGTTISINLPGTETYTLSGFAKANSLPTANNASRDFKLYAELIYTDGTYEHHAIEFQSDIQAATGIGWQYGSVAVVPKCPEKTVKVIQPFCQYRGNGNVVYFDNISLVRNYAQAYKYNADGKLVGVQSSEGNNSEFTYSGANLTKAITKGSGIYTYNYDAANNPTKATNEKISVSMAYDAAGNATSSTLSDTGNPKTMKSSATYTGDKNRIASVTDANNVTVTNSYGNNISVMNGTPTKINNSGTGVAIVNSYDAANGRPTLTYQNGHIVVRSNYNSEGRLTSIDRDAYLSPNTGSKQMQYYKFEYDPFGYITSIKVEGATGVSRSLANYEYEAYNGNLKKLTYGNGATVNYTYDKYDRLSTVRNQDGSVHTYTYTGDGTLAKAVNSGTNSQYLYDYDQIGRLVNFTEKTGNAVNINSSYKYDPSNRLVKYSYTIPELSNTTRYEESTYNNNNGNLASFKTAAGENLTYAYESVDRLTKINVGSYALIKYGYIDDNVNRIATPKVSYKSHTILGVDSRGMSYTYDNASRITTENNSMTGYVNNYTYDSQNQLKTAVMTKGTTKYNFDYTYDCYGNIRSKKQTQGSTVKTDTYSYTHPAYLDLLTAYNGKAILHDPLGNPLTYHDGTTFTWKNGRQMATQKNTSKGLDVSYTYDIDGIRTAKTVKSGSTTTNHKYYLQGNKIVAETRGSNKLEFIYDAAGSPLNLIYNGTKYYYITNALGDVVQLRNTSNGVVAEYIYDPYGALISSSGNMAAINPLRYRSYYFDTESGLYYLNSRYYDPAVGRFINADGYVSTGTSFLGYNMFAYCNNNPINMEDSEGNRPIYSASGNEAEEAKYQQEAREFISEMPLVAGSLIISLKKGWSARIDPQNDAKGEMRHIHIERNGVEYSQNDDGSPHKGSKGSPPNSVKKEVLEKFKWDWEKKAQSYENQSKLMLHVEGCNLEKGECKCDSYGMVGYGNFFFPSPHANAPALPSPSWSFPFAFG